MEERESLIEIKELEVSYGEIKALRGITLSVKKHECVSVVGANGAGKSTLLKTIMGLTRKNKGQIIYSGRDISNLPAHRRAKLGISLVPEGGRVFPKIPVIGNLMLGAYREKNKRIIEQRVEEVFSIFPRLAERKNQTAGTLSGGERQMLAVARALMSEPELLMIDEISLGLMPKLVDTVFETIETLHKRGITLLLAEQNAQKAIEVSQRIYILELGRIVKHGAAEGIIEDEDIKKAYLGY